MTFRISLIAAAAALTLGQLPSQAVAAPTAHSAQTTATAAAPDAAAASASAALLKARSPTEWIEYNDTTYTPVLDDVSRALRDARTALSDKDNAKAAEAMSAAASALQVQADRAGKIDRRRAAADLKLAHTTHDRLAALARKLAATAVQIKSGKLVSTAALDKTLDRAARADLERRWLVTDVADWFPVADEPQRHFGAAAEAFAKKDYAAAAAEVRKAAAYVRLESARTAGEAKRGLDAASADLDRSARDLDKGAVKARKDMDQAFARTDRALALAHRAKAAESWSRKAYDDAGYELKAAAQGLEEAAAWTGDEAKSAASAGVSEARAVGDKLASGGVWAKNEVARGFDSLGGALNQLGHSIGSKSKASPVDVGA
ncbi:MAG: hypothetical protein ABI564_10085 [Ideonella sp.]